MGDVVDRADVAVVGAGVVGLAAALAVSAHAGPRPRVVVLDPGLDAATRPDPNSGSLRAVAIAPASRRLLARLGVWDAVVAVAAPIRRMVLTDSDRDAAPAPDLLHFGDDASPGLGEPLAHMVAQDALRDALLQACRARGIVFRAEAVRALAVERDAAVLTAGPASTLRARLVVAADGSRSRLREMAGIGTVGHDYGQTAVVATLSHSRDHDGIATQHFLPGGPLALLPLRAPDGTGRWTSIVWTERHEPARALMRLPPAAFCDALLAHAGDERGAFALEDRPAAHPLRLALSRSLAAPRLVLAGDAARTIHPLAGQGLNLGLQDVEALGRMTAVLALGLDPGAPRVLDAFERERRPAQLAFAATTDGLNRLFSNNNGALRLVRDIGLGLVDRAPSLKAALIRRAAGRTIDAPEGSPAEPPRHDARR